LGIVCFAPFLLCTRTEDSPKVPLSEDTNIGLLQSVIANQTDILKSAYGPDVDISTIPQIWALCTISSICLVGLMAHMYCFSQIKRSRDTTRMVCGSRIISLSFGQMISMFPVGSSRILCTVLTIDSWGNIRRLPYPAERNRTGGAGVYYHVGNLV